MNILILGANGMLGPYVIKALQHKHKLRLTDINENEDPVHEYFKLDIGDQESVVKAAEGMDLIINLSVLRHERDLAFKVNAIGTYNAMVAAVRNGIKRVINTGPHFTLAGPTYEWIDYQIGPDIPPQPGTNLYAITKSLGQETCRIFSENHDIEVITLLFYHFLDDEPDKSRYGQDLTPYAITWSDAAEAFEPAITIDADLLPSKCETFFVFTDLPHGRFSNEKAKKILGWEPKNNLKQIWTK